MGKFLILNHPPAHPTKRSRVGACVNHFNNLELSGRAKVYPVVGMKGYATFVDAEDHDVVRDILGGNPMGHTEEYTLIALRDLDD